ncbi:MAG: dehydrogenase [Christensenellaceae bacterium]|jgi:2-oxoisovalerate dehydrogenase E1 component|nr:dehydrogenase [Christensenellaceae bacterium]
MPKSLFYDPNAKRQPGEITFSPIPVNAYQKKMRDIRAEYTDADLVSLFYDMVVIREFETMMQELRLTGKYKDASYDYSGPAHLCIGQEAAAVGQAYLLDKDDIIFGTHRSHGEVIAKGFSAIRKLDDETLMKVMREFDGGKQLSVVEKGFHGTVPELAIRFYLYGLMAELFGREIGFSKGLGNSMHAFFMPFGVYPNNAIVGGSAPIAAGAALYKKIHRQQGIVIANAGDGSVGCGPVWEALNFASMDQYRTLWDNKGGLPILFYFTNNGYGMGGQTAGETMAYDMLARIGAGVNPEQMHAERVDGFNVFAVIDAVRRKKEILERQQGPALLDVVTYRFCGHSASDASPNRTQEEIRAWEDQDALESYGAQLVENDILSAEQIEQLRLSIGAQLMELFKTATDPELSPRMDLLARGDSIEKYMFSNEPHNKLGEGAPAVLAPKEENPRWQRNQKKSRYGKKDGKALPSAAVIQIRDAIFEALLDKFYEDPSLVSFGEDLRDWGSAYGTYKDMEKSIPYERLFNAPISESTIVGASVGYAMLGGRVASELMYCDFLGRAGDEVFNQLAKWQAMTAGQLHMPVVLRMGIGSKYGAQHSQEWSSLCAHVPGLKVVYPVTPYDAKGLLNAALSGSDPVIYLESQSLYGMGELFQKDGVPVDYYEIPIGEPDVKRAGEDLTILTFGATLYRALAAADRFAEYGIGVEVIDARSIVPFNYDKVIESVKKTGKLIIASDACQRGSFLNDFAQNIGSLAFDYLDAPVLVLGARNWVTPVYELEKDFFPQAEWFLDAYHQKIQPLQGYTPTRSYTDAEMLRRGKLGV